MSHHKHHHHHDHHTHDDHQETAPSRRSFLKGAAAGSLAVLGSGFGMPNIALGATGTKTIVKIFMRGGADGLSLFPMYGDLNYYTLRPNINIDAPLASDPNSAIRLNAMYGMNPNLISLMEIWDTGRMAISPATHFAEGNRSHFDCQAWIEAASTSVANGGVFNRYLQAVPGTDNLRAVRAGSSNLAGSMAGPIIVPSIDDGPGYTLKNGDWCQGSGCSDNQLTTKLLQLGSAPVGNAMEQQTRNVTKTMVDTIATVQSASANYVPTAGGMTYADGRNGRPYSSIGRGLQVVAQLVKAGIPVEVAAIDWGGSWDTHENYIGASITDQTAGHAKNMKLGADNLLTFWRDLGPLRDNVIVMIGSEFGREAVENGSKGTDHGTGGAWMAFGGPTNGGIYQPMPNLATTSLNNGRFLPSLLNYKDMLAEAMTRHMGVNQSLMSTLFPGHTLTNHNMFTRTV
jgi:uncharacterized protein (DUF1501 family)